MAIDYCVLASGSKGNALWVRGGGVQVLVDCGISSRRLAHRLAEVGGDIRDIQAVVCTHGHGDHVGGVSVLARRHGARIYATEGTRGWIPGKPPKEALMALPTQGQVAIGGLTVNTVPTMHDAPQSVALVLRDDETALGVVTDLGLVTEAVVKAFSGLDGLVLETNHDAEMLRYGPYPAHLIKRIAGERGHLSNAQGAALLRRVVHPGLQHLTCAHLSEQNNTPEKARAVAEEVLGETGHRPGLAVAEQDRPGVPVCLGARKQLGLPLW